ncbi:MAG: hypothetical protein JXA97_06390 [Anaerolineales bacterium]|nr:hypothetical protein [Anaerolineales bacterium]
MIEGLQFITGQSGSGKTTLCQKLVTEMASKGLAVGGMLSPPVFEGSRKTNIDLLDLWTGERRCLARRYHGAENGLVTRKWLFDEAVIDWGNAILQQRLPCDVFFFDEIGPVEVVQGRGFLEALTIFDERFYPDSVLVLRPSLLSYARWRWPWGILRPPGDVRQAV